MVTFCYLSLCLLPSTKLGSQVLERGAPGHCWEWAAYMAEWWQVKHIQSPCFSSNSSSCLAQNKAGLISYSSFERPCIKRLRFRILHPFNTWLRTGGMYSDINVTKKIYAQVKVISKKEVLSLIIFGQELCPSSGDKSACSSCDSSLSLRPEQLNWGNDQF